MQSSPFKCDNVMIIIIDIIKDGRHECNGFNVALARNQGHSVKYAMTAIGPIHPVGRQYPLYPDTIMYAIVEAQRLANECGQTITVFANDQLCCCERHTGIGQPTIIHQLCTKTRRLLVTVIVTAEREKDRPLHLWAVAEILPYFKYHCTPCSHSWSSFFPEIKMNRQDKYTGIVAYYHDV